MLPVDIVGTGLSGIALKSAMVAKYGAAEAEVIASVATRMSGTAREAAVAEEIGAVRGLTKLVPSGLGSTGRTIANNLNEKLAMDEILANPRGLGIKTSAPPLSDPRWLGWFKYSYYRSFSGGTSLEIHFNAKLDQNGLIIAVDDFKFK
jgi:hypothetical protein